jgi:glucose-1-phosphate cytidylyltransferase
MHYGFNDFVICLGYKGEMIKEYFLNYEAFNNDITLEYGQKCKIKPIHNGQRENFKVTLVDTGSETMTGGRIKRIEKYIDSDDFFMTYGDGVSNVNIKALYAFHLSHGKVATITGVRPDSHFGELVVSGDTVIAFSEKPQSKDGLISGGFFVLKKKIFRYIPDKDCFFEQEPMKNLLKNNQLKVNKHKGFWHCMDTMRDVKQLNDMWDSGQAPWKVWK